MSEFSYRKRIELIQLRTVHDYLERICKIMEQTPSSYTPVKKMIFDIRRNRDGAGQFARKVKRAYRLAVKEEKIVSFYNLTMSKTNGSFTNYYREVDLKYRVSIQAGDYRGAQRYVRELSQVVDCKDYRNCDLNVSCNRAEGRIVTLLISNNTEAPVIVKSVNIMSPHSAVRVIDSSGFSIPAGGQRIVKTMAAEEGQIRLDVCVDYDIRNKNGRLYTSVDVV